MLKTLFWPNVENKQFRVHALICARIHYGIGVYIGDSINVAKLQAIFNAAAYRTEEIAKITYTSSFIRESLH